MAGFFYKIILNENALKSWQNAKASDVEITHNIPENKIVDFKKLGCRARVYGSTWYRSPTLIMDSNKFKEYVQPYLVYPTENNYKLFNKNIVSIGCAIVRGENGDIITYFSYDGENDCYILNPAYYINHYSYDFYNICINNLPKRNIKIFMTYDEYLVDKQKKEHESTRKRQEKQQQLNTIKITVPVFSLWTPKFKIVQIVKKTDWLPNVKEGDIIVGELPVITNSNGCTKRHLNGGMSYSNYINVHVNDDFVRSISPLTFQDLFFNNYIVEQI